MRPFLTIVASLNPSISVLLPLQSSHIRRIVALRASFEVLRHLAPTDDDESGDSSLSTTGEEDSLRRRRAPSNFVPAPMLKELVTKVSDTY